MSDQLQQQMQVLFAQAKSASRVIGNAITSDKNKALLAIADEIKANQQAILDANAKDMDNAHQNQLEASLLDRLELNASRVQQMIENLEQVAGLTDPVGEIVGMQAQPSGIQVGQMRVPLGVIGIIYESRPNVTIETASLCIKSGNAVILRGGSEAIHSNQILGQCIQQGLKAANLDPNVAQVIQTTDRAAVGMLITADKYVDIVVPRGGKGLIERVSKEATVPTIKHLDGICHTYVDQYACLDKATSVCLNAKTQRLGTCNTMETLLIHESIASDLLVKLAPLYLEQSVEIKACHQTAKVLDHLKIDYSMATEEDWDTEYLAAILSIKLVSDMDEAIDHIESHGSHHTDAIITQDITTANRFVKAVNSSSVMVNTSTRFADGFEYGLGAEMGISTDKIHARGPVGLIGLTSLKFVVYSDGQIRQ